MDRIETAAKAIYETMYPDPGSTKTMPRWNAAGDGCRTQFRAYAARALEAADRFDADEANESHFGPGPNKREPGRGD